MKPMLPKTVVASTVIAMCIATGSLFPRANAQHTEQRGPADMRPEFDNAAMVVMRIRLAPHEKTGMHELTPRLVIWLTDAYLRDTKPDGAVTDYRRAAGSTEWVPAQRHAGENLSDAPIEFLAVVPKKGTAAGEPHAAH